MTAMVILHIPHSSVHIPDEIRDGLLLDKRALDRELLAMTDWYTDELFQLPRSTRVIFPVSRLVVDPERFLDDSQEAMSQVGMGVVYTRTSAGESLRPEPSSAIRARLIESYYTPHHAALTRAVDAVLHCHGGCLVIDCHSFPSHPLPYEPDQSPNRPQICLGTDGFHTPPQLRQLTRDVFSKAGWTVAFDRPFGGALVPMDHYGQDEHVHALMVEVNRGLYMDEATGRRIPDFDKTMSALHQVLQNLSQGWAEFFLSSD